MAATPQVNQRVEVKDLALRARAPRGQIGYSESSVTVSGIVAETVVRTVIVSVSAGRSIRISAIGNIARTVGDGLTLFSIKEGGFLFHAVKTGTGEETISLSAIETPIAGAHTYTLTLQNFSGTGSSSVNSGGNSPFYILVEDLGAI